MARRQGRINIILFCYSFFNFCDMDKFITLVNSVRLYTRHARKVIAIFCERWNLDILEYFETRLDLVFLKSFLNVFLLLMLIVAN